MLNEKSKINIAQTKYSLSVCFSEQGEASAALLTLETTVSTPVSQFDFTKPGITLLLEDNSIIILLPTDALALSALLYLEKRFGREKLRLRQSDGWECCEAELLGSSYIENRYLELFRDDKDQSAIYTEAGKHKTKKLILASKSPRRREYLKLTGIPFTCETADVDEQNLLEEANQIMRNEPFGVKAACTVMYLAEKKASQLLPEHKHATIIGSDTLVTIDGAYLGKPASPEEALSMLRRLAGRDHHVWTGVSIVEGSRITTFYSSTRVRFFPWSEQMEQVAKDYVLSGSPMDKAGAYGIQDMGALLIQEIRGDFYTVVGLPISATAQHLRTFGYS